MKEQINSIINIFNINFLIIHAPFGVSPMNAYIIVQDKIPLINNLFIIFDIFIYGK